MNYMGKGKKLQSDKCATLRHMFRTFAVARGKGLDLVKSFKPPVNDNMY